MNYQEKQRFKPQELNGMAKIPTRYVYCLFSLFLIRYIRLLSSDISGGAHRGFRNHRGMHPGEAEAVQTEISFPNMDVLSGSTGAVCSCCVSDQYF